MIDAVPSIPFFTTVSLPELVWVVLAVVASGLNIRAWLRSVTPKASLKNGIRAVTSVAFVLDGLLASVTPQAINPTWLSVTTPMAVALATFAMALLAVIDDQTRLDRDL